MFTICLNMPDSILSSNHFILFRSSISFFYILMVDMLLIATDWLAWFYDHFLKLFLLIHKCKSQTLNVILPYRIFSKLCFLIHTVKCFFNYFFYIFDPNLFKYFFILQC